MAGTTPKLALRYPSSGDADNVPTDMQNLATDMEQAVAGTGLLAARPAAGHQGKIWRATDTGQIFRDNGTTWDELVLKAVADAAYLAKTAGTATDGSGRLSVLGTVSNGSNGNAASTTLHAQSAITTPLVVQAFASGTANLEEFQLSGGTVVLAVNQYGGLQPSNFGLSVSTSAVYGGSGAPSNANGNNGDFYLRMDTPGTANQRIYTRSAGVWVGIA